MAQLLQAFDARNVDPTQGVGGLPIGKHPVMAIKSEVKPTKDNDSGYLQLDLQVIDGPAKGAVGAYRLNLYHSSAQTVEIAHKQLSALCHVTGVFQVQDSQQLHNIPFVVEVGMQKEPNPNKYTEIKRVFDINGNEPGQGGGNGAAQAQQGNFGGGNQWRQRCGPSATRQLRRRQPATAG
uniref:Single-stranded DNA-binding protein n=1 Tax=Pseudomonas phage Pavpe01 TaxID=3138545 RepID=A0AAU6W0K9_9VIRU